MVFNRKKKSPLDRRLEELHKEMTRLDRDLKTVSRSHPEISGVPSRKSAVPFYEGVPPAPPAGLEPPAGVVPVVGANAPEGDLFAYAAVSGAPAATQAADLFPGLPAKSVIPARPEQSGATLEHRSGREKFAHYFMAGHFQNLRPSRQESRIVRNKAILMLIAVAVVAALLLYVLSSH